MAAVVLRAEARRGLPDVCRGPAGGDELRDQDRRYTVVIWRGRHVAEPTELEPDEATAYWLEVLRVGRALEEHLQPVKLNYDVLGNSLPHLHTHVIPRYAEDPRPGWPFPFPEGDPPPHPELRRDAEILRALLA
jgi:diadenosine tetraphosphate (Ap4A) HIT family hydrolase